MSLLRRWRSLMPSVKWRKRLMGVRPAPSYRHWNSALTEAVEKKCPVPSGEHEEQCLELREALLKAVPRKLALDSADAHALLADFNAADAVVAQRELDEFVVDDETALYREVCFRIVQKRVDCQVMSAYGRQVLSCIVRLWTADRQAL